MTPHLFLYVILTVTAPTKGHCGQEVSAASYSPVRMEATDFRLNEFGELVNRKKIKFSAPKQSWGVIEGFCILDSSGHVLSYGHLTSDIRVAAGDNPPELDVVIPKADVEKMREKLSQNLWWIR